MSRPIVVKCDECGEIKRSTNHWYTSRTDEFAGTLILGRLDESTEPLQGTSDLCSHDCLIKLVSRWMQELTR